MDVGIMDYGVKSYLEAKKPEYRQVDKQFFNEEDVKKQKRNVSL